MKTNNDMYNIQKSSTKSMSIYETGFAKTGILTVLSTCNLKENAYIYLEWSVFHKKMIKNKNYRIPSSIILIHW